jgi:hypothetical protein
MKSKSTIDQVIDNLTWLDNNRRANNIHEISLCLAKLASLSVTLGENVSEAYRLQSEAEDNYDIAFAEKFSSLTREGTSAAAAKPIVEAELGKMRREWTAAKVNHKKLSTFIDRLDKVLETHRQQLSISKLEAKNI